MSERSFSTHHTSDSFSVGTVFYSYVIKVIIIVTAKYEDDCADIYYTWKTPSGQEVKLYRQLIPCTWKLVAK